MSYSEKHDKKPYFSANKKTRKYKGPVTRYCIYSFNFAFTVFCEIVKQNFINK